MNLYFTIAVDTNLTYQQISGIWNTLLTTLELLCAWLQKLLSGTWQFGSLYWQLDGYISGQSLLLHLQGYTVSESCTKHKSEWNTCKKMEEKKRLNILSSQQIKLSSWSNSKCRFLCYSDSFTQADKFSQNLQPLKIQVFSDINSTWQDWKLFPTSADFLILDCAFFKQGTNCKIQVKIFFSETGY